MSDRELIDRDVHPVADLFPMLEGDDLGELASSIAERGLDHPIVLDAEGRILDGRNRYVACRIAGVEPRFVTYDGDDADDYALRSGIVRRHLTTGARAMIAARAARLNGRGGQVRAANLTDLQEARISEAVTVLDWTPALADAVIAGSKPLSVAVEEARAEKRDAEALKAKRDRLQADAPDLMELVGEGRMDIDEAISLVEAREDKAHQEEREREAKRESERRAAISNLRSVLTYLTSTSITPKELAVTYIDVLYEFDQADLEYATRTMRAIADLKGPGDE